MNSKGTAKEQQSLWDVKRIQQVTRMTSTHTSEATPEPANTCYSNAEKRNKKMYLKKLRKSEQKYSS